MRNSALRGGLGVLVSQLQTVATFQVFADNPAGAILEGAALAGAASSGAVNERDVDATTLSSRAAEVAGENERPAVEITAVACD